MNFNTAYCGWLATADVLKHVSDVLHSMVNTLKQGIYSISAPNVGEKFVYHGHSLGSDKIREESHWQDRRIADGRLCVCCYLEVISSSRC